MKKTVVKLIGLDGNVFAIIGLVSLELTKDGKKREAEAFTEEAFRCKSYDEVLQLVMRTVDVK